MGKRFGDLGCGGIDFGWNYCRTASRRTSNDAANDIVAGCCTSWPSPPRSSLERRRRRRRTTKTVKKEEVKTWTQTIDGKEWSMRLGTPSYEGDTGLFRLSSAYVLPKGKAAFSLFRDNYDRDPKGIDFSIHGLNVAWGATDKLEIFGQFGLQNRTKVNYIAQPGFYNDLPFAGGRAAGRPASATSSSAPSTASSTTTAGDGVGLALRGLVKFGTADEAKGLGTGTSGGGDRPHPLEEPELQGRPACLDRLRVPGRPERGGRRHP